MQTSFHVHGVTCGCALDVRATGETDTRPRVVIVGAGFGGLSAAKALHKADVRVTLVDRRNHHLFQPLLYQVATAGLSPGQIATPIRTVLRDQKNAEVLLGTVTGVDVARRQVLLGGHEINYDYLVLATGVFRAPPAPAPRRGTRPRLTADFRPVPPALPAAPPGGAAPSAPPAPHRSASGSTPARSGARRPAGTALVRRASSRPGRTSTAQPPAA